MLAAHLLLRLQKNMDMVEPRRRKIINVLNVTPIAMRERLDLAHQIYSHPKPRPHCIPCAFLWKSEGKDDRLF